MLQQLAEEMKPLMHLTTERAEQMYHNGGMSERAFKGYCLFWDWAAAHFGPCQRQSRVAARYGRPAVVRRINRFRAALGLELYPINS